MIARFTLISLFIYLSALSDACNAQSRLTITAPDTLAFQLNVNSNPVNTTLMTSCTFFLNEIGKQVFRATFSNNTFIEQSIALKENTHATYEIRMIKGALRFALLSEASYIPVAPTGLSVVIDSASVPEEFTEGFDGAPGCENPCSTEDFENLKTALKEVSTDTRRLEMTRTFAALHCLRVEQLRYLLSRIELEDHRLKLLEAAASNIYDRSRLNAVEDDFFLAKNKSRVREIIAE